MSAIEPYLHLPSTFARHLSEREVRLFEAELFCNLYREIKFYFRSKYYEELIDLVKPTKKEEDTMLEADFLKTLINDILATNEYTLAGIAYYTDTPEEVILEIITGQNQRPSALLMQRAIDLHRLVKKDLYKQLIKKILSYYKASEYEA